MYEKITGMVADNGEQTLANRIAAQGMPSGGISTPTGMEDDDCVCLTQLCEEMPRIKAEIG